MGYCLIASPAGDPDPSRASQDGGPRAGPRAATGPDSPTREEGDCSRRDSNPRCRVEGPISLTGLDYGSAATGWRAGTKAFGEGAGATVRWAQRSTRLAGASRPAPTRENGLTDPLPALQLLDRR